MITTLPFYPGIAVQMQLGDKLHAVLAHAAMRRALHDDEHMPPLPIWGSARLHDRMPHALYQLTPIERSMSCRVDMTQRADDLGLRVWALSYTNNEEGA